MVQIPARWQSGKLLFSPLLWRFGIISSQMTKSFSRRRKASAKEEPSDIDPSARPKLAPHLHQPRYKGDDKSASFDTPAATTAEPH